MPVVAVCCLVRFLDQDLGAVAVVVCYPVGTADLGRRPEGLPLEHPVVVAVVLQGVSLLLVCLS